MAAACPTSPRRRSTTVRDRPSLGREIRGQRRHELLDARASFSPPSLCVVHPSSTQRTAKVQTAAAIISLLNDYLLSRGNPPLGFLIPWLYGDDLAGLNDIISGFNPGCDTDGFSAIAG